MNRTTRLVLTSATVLGLALGGASAAGADTARNTFRNTATFPDLDGPLDELPGQQ